MSLPEIEFSKWHWWKQRSDIANSGKPGIYMLAKFVPVPQGNADPLDSNIIYFGETCKGLRGRWNQFDRSAFQSKRGHSGGINYRKFYGDIGQHLFVAAMPVIIQDKTLSSTFIRFAERKLLLDFAVKHGRLPQCNLR